MSADNQNVSDGQRRSKGRSVSLQARPLMLPQEVNELPYEEALIFMQPTRTTPPMKIRARKIFWYDEPIFCERVNEAHYPLPEVPESDTARIERLVVPVRTQNAHGVAVSRARGGRIA